MDNYRALYKVPAKSGILRGDAKRENAVREQKKKREDTFFERRNIRQDLGPSSSTVSSPARKPKKQETRREKLLRWKAEKEKLIAQQKIQEKKKPPFKAGVPHHMIDPNLELKATSLKCMTAKKAAAETRLDAAVTRKAKPATDASKSLAALSARTAESVSSAAFTGRVTRSRTAAAAAVATTSKTGVKSKSAIATTSKAAANSKGVVITSKIRAESKVKKSAPQTAVASSSSILKAPKSVSKQPKNAVNARGAKPASQKPAGASKEIKEKLEASFAPKDHKFKAPINLTLPTTPLTLKRKASGVKEAGWPQIAGVGILDTSPVGPSPKIKKTEKSVPPASQRRGRLSTAVKGRTPQKSPKTKKASDAESLKPKMRRSLHRTGSGAFIVSDMTTPSKDVITTPQEGADAAEEFAETAESNSKDRPRRSMSHKKSNKSLKGKENVPSEEAETNEPEVPDIWSLLEPDMEPVIVSSRRMSIHDPSPPVHVSPEKLTGGMVPAQFSPFITSARGKDKYSINKRRSSLIPIVPEIPPEELARSKQTEHFRNLLERESSRLLTLSGVWDERIAEAPPTVQDMILGPVGQARLLVKDKFQQFRRLVDKFEIGDSEGKITTDDLTGFWEMVLLTVENIDKRFKDLEDLRLNNWEEKAEESQSKKLLAVAPVASKPVKPRTQTQSRLKDIIEAARKKRQEKKKNKSTNVSTDVTTFDGGFFKVESPKKMLPSPKPKSISPAPKITKVLLTTPRQLYRRSLLQQVLTNSAVRAQNSPASSPLNLSLPVSPSPKVVVAQMRASELGKRMSMDNLNDSFSPDPSSPILKLEPTKSILKSARRSMRMKTPRNRVAFEELKRSANSSSASPTLLSPVSTTPIRTPVSERIATPGSRKRTSLIPRLIPTPKGDRPSLLPMRESLVSSKPLSNGDLIDFDSPRRSSLA